MHKGMKAATLTDTAASAFFSNHIKHAMLKPRALFDLGDKINADGLTTRWSTVRQHSAAIDELLVMTAGRVPKHANLLKQFIEWLKSHGVNWSWKDADRAMQHFRSMIRSLQHSSLTGKAPKNYDDLQPLVDKFIDARKDDEEVSIVAQPHKFSKRPLQVASSDDEPQKSELKVPKSVICKTESESEPELKPFSRRLPACYQRFSAFINHPAAVIPVEHTVTAIVPKQMEIVEEAAENIVEKPRSTETAIVPFEKPVIVPVEPPKVLDANELLKLAQDVVPAPTPQAYSKQKKDEQK